MLLTDYSKTSSDDLLILSIIAVHSMHFFCWTLIIPIMHHSLCPCWTDGGEPRGGRPGPPPLSSRLPLSLTLAFLSGKHGRLIIALPAHSAHSFLLSPYCIFQLLPVQ